MENPRDPDRARPASRSPCSPRVCGCSDLRDGIVWAFDWSDVPGATRYHIHVEAVGASRPVIDYEVTASFFGNASPRAYIEAAVEPMDTDCR